MTLGGRIRQRRIERGWNAAELARRAQVSTSYLSKLERDRPGRPSAEVLDRLARALGTTVADLLDRGEYAEPAAVPDGLRRFAEEAALPDEVVRMLAGISYRGRRPRTPGDWGYLLESIKRAIKGTLE